MSQDRTNYLKFCEVVLVVYGIAATNDIHIMPQLKVKNVLISRNESHNSSHQSEQTANIHRRVSPFILLRSVFIAPYELRIVLVHLQHFRIY